MPFTVRLPSLILSSQDALALAPISGVTTAACMGVSLRRSKLLPPPEATGWRW